MTGSRPSASGSATFELERFAWGGPDRLEVSGRFVGLGEAPGGAPVLMLRGPAGTQRLSGSVSDGPDEDGRWRAEFPWSEPPAAFDAAELELGEDLLVVLPEPTARKRLFGRRALEIRRSGAPEDADSPAGMSTDRLRLQADLIAAKEQARELRGKLEHAHGELAATRTALDAERQRHAEDAERFRSELTDVGVAAEEAVAADRDAAQRLGEQLAEREQALEQALSDGEALRVRLAELEGEADALRSRVAELERAAEEARGGLEQALRRLTPQDAARKRDSRGG